MRIATATRPVLVALLVIGATAAIAPPAAADTITVTITTDTTADDGLCSLREAVQAANTNTGVSGCAHSGAGGTDTITLGAESYQVNRSQGSIYLQSPIDLVGAGKAATTITEAPDSGTSDQLLMIEGAVEMRDLTVDGGTGRAMQVDAGDSLDLLRVGVANSDTNGTGAGIFNSGTLGAIQSSFDANSAHQKGGAIYNNGGTVSIDRTLFYANRGGQEGGAIWSSGSLFISQSTFTANYGDWETSYGGAIWNSGTATVAQSTFNANQATGYGGAVYNFNSGTIDLDNSTLSGNLATDTDDFGGTHGGAIANQGALTVNNSTIVDNLSDTNSAGIWMIGYVETSSTFSNTIIANNTLADGTLANCNAGYPPTSEGYNLEDETSEGATTCDFDDPESEGGPNLDLAPAEPRLLPLGSYGGPTKTRPGRPTSPVLDAGSPAPAGEEGACEEVDQRGVARPQDSSDAGGIPVCDVGAFEMRIVGNNKAITFTLRRHLRAVGRVTTDQSPSCVKNEPVQIQRRRRPDSGTFVIVATTRTDAEGRYEVTLPDQEGTYRARTSRSQSFVGGDIHTCEPSWSSEPYPRHAHN